MGYYLRSGVDVCVGVWAPRSEEQLVILSPSCPLYQRRTMYSKPSHKPDATSHSHDSIRYDMILVTML